jgi:hypothetical protein
LQPVRLLRGTHDGHKYKIDLVSPLTAVCLLFIAHHSLAETSASSIFRHHLRTHFLYIIIMVPSFKLLGVGVACLAILANAAPAGEPSDGLGIVEVSCSRKRGFTKNNH